MYHGRRALRILVILGTFGLAALVPQLVRGPTWLGVGACLLPLVLFELGALLAEDAAAGTRRWRLGCRLQLGAGALFLAGVCAGAGAITPGLRGAPFLVGLASLGVIAAAITWFDYGRLRRGEELVASDPLGAGERRARAGEQAPRSTGGAIKDALAIIGGQPIVLGAIAFTLVGVAAVVLVRRGGQAPEKVWTAIAFFTGCGLVSVWQALQRWETFVPNSRRAGPARVVVQCLSFLLFGGAMFVFGYRARTDPGGSQVMAYGAMVFGAFLLVGAPAVAWRAVRGRGRTRAGFRFVREGLLERSRRATFLYPWDGILSVALGSFHQQTAVYVVLDHEGAVEGPADRLAKKARSLRRSHDWFGAHVIIFDTLADAPLGDLYRDAAAALEDPTAREGLPPAGRSTPHA